MSGGGGGGGQLVRATRDPPITSCMNKMAAEVGSGNETTYMIGDCCRRTGNCRSMAAEARAAHIDFPTMSSKWNFKNHRQKYFPRCLAFWSNHA